ncbi:MAG: hypothetical protein [Bacteriophage sp.]|nr:MAG: hypothetical protein [Bacteriophage sp.]
MTTEKGSVNLGYLVTCETHNGNVIPAFTDSFSSAMEIAERFEGGEYTKKVKILKISTGATFEYVI